MDSPDAPSYRRLSGRTAWIRFGAVSAPSSTLWLGPDHLLKVERTAGSENYKRFFYRDIQVILVEASSRRYYLNIFGLAIIGLIFLLTLVISSSAISGLPTALILSSPFIAGLILNLILGPTSSARLVTAVGTETLSSLCRMRSAVDALQRIGEEVTKVQGELPSAKLLQHWPALVATGPVD